MKICSKCKVPKPFSNFSKSSANKDGLYAWCKDCKADSQRYYRQTEVGKECHSKYQKKYRKTKFGKLKRNKGRKLWKLNYPERNKAHTAVHRALKMVLYFNYHVRCVIVLILRHIMMIIVNH